MHHSAYADSSEFDYFNAIEPAHIGLEVGIALLQTAPYSFGAVGPQSVGKLVFPFMRTLRYRAVLRVDEHSLDAGRAELDSEHGLTLFYSFFCISLHNLSH